MRKALLVNCSSDIEFLTNNPLYGSQFISRNILTDFELENKQILFNKYPLVKDKNSYDFVVWLALNWFRDENGNDLSANDGISLGNIIARRVLSVFANDYRNYHSIRSILSDYDILYASKSESKSFKRVSKIFGKRIHFYNDEAKLNKVFSPDPEFTNFYNYPKVHPLSSIALLIQKPFMPIVKKRHILNISDWSSKDEWSKRGDCLIQNSLFPWKGFYFTNVKELHEDCNIVFPNKIDENVLNIDRIFKKTQKKWNIHNNKLINHFCKIINQEYLNGKKIFKKTYSIFKQAFSYYNPKSLIIPGETHFAYVIATQIAKSLGINTVLAIDGYIYVVDESLLYKDKNNKNLIFDKFLAYNLSHRKILSKMGVDVRSCLISQSPLLNKQKNIKRKNKTNYDAIVMSYQPRQNNPQITWDQRGCFVVDIINLLINNNFERIALKVKSISDQAYYEEFLKLHNLRSFVDILYKPTHEYVNKTKLVIGQYSTAMFEFSFNKIPYFVYEPFENGKTEEMINSALVFNRESISRDINELKTHLNNNTHSLLIDHKAMFEGIPVSEIKSSSFI